MAGEETKDKVKAALEQLDQGIKAFFESDNLKEYLKVMGQFHHYSARNCVLIATQMRARGFEDFSGRLAGYNDWKKNFNRQVKKGERGIMILAPVRRSLEVEVPGKTNQDGQPVKEKKEYMTFRPVYVFHEHQTEGDPLPELVKRLDFTVDGYEKIRNALIQATDCPVIFEAFPEDDSINGYFNPVRNEIHIREGMSEAQTIKTLLHESLHQVLHPDALSDKSRQEKELEAEAGAFCVASAYLGIDTSDYSIPYLGSWSEGKSLSEMKECIENIKRGSDILIGKLDRILCLEMSKEEAAMEQKEERTLELIESAGVKAESVSIVADRAGTLALVAVESEKDEQAVISMNDREPEETGERISFATVNVGQDYTPDYQAYRGSYDRDRCDSSWPMVQIRYTNVSGMIRDEMNILEFQQMLDRLPNEVLEDRTKYFMVCISYTYMDRKCQRLADVELGGGRVDYLDFLPLEEKHITHLRSHSDLLRTCYTVRHLSPRTEQTMEYEDSILEWAGYCREILNHDSEHPHLPCVPDPPGMSKQTDRKQLSETTKDWRLEL
ncbi:MAG: hypothetical protein IKN79_03160 [Eubacterium sp.]|nr:hypothetical protein [Eubacterium sp.]